MVQPQPMHIKRQWRCWRRCIPTPCSRHRRHCQYQGSCFLCSEGAVVRAREESDVDEQLERGRTRTLFKPVQVNPKPQWQRQKAEPKPEAENKAKETLASAPKPRLQKPAIKSKGRKPAASSAIAAQSNTDAMAKASRKTSWMFLAMMMISKWIVTPQSWIVRTFRPLWNYRWRVMFWWSWTFCSDVWVRFASKLTIFFSQFLWRLQLLARVWYKSLNFSVDCSDGQTDWDGTKHMCGASSFV